MKDADDDWAIGVTNAGTRVAAGRACRLATVLHLGRFKFLQTTPRDFEVLYICVNHLIH